MLPREKPRRAPPDDAIRRPQRRATAAEITSTHQLDQRKGPDHKTQSLLANRTSAGTHHEWMMR